MEQGHESFRDITPITPPVYLFDKVIKRINSERELAVVRKKAVYFSLALIGSLVLFLAAFISLSGTLIQSEILKLLSVFVSDPGASLANWRNFGLFLLEALPVVHLALFFAALLAVLQSLKYVVKNLTNIFLLSKPFNVIN